MLTTELTKKLGIRTPIIQAPIGGISMPTLVAAVSNAGGLGMLSGTWRKPTDLQVLLNETRALTNAPFAVNFVLAFDIHEQLELCLKAGIKIFSFFWGDPSPYIAAIHAVQGIVMHTVGSAAEARTAVDNGVDILIAQGVEAGGHVWGEVSSFALLPAIADAVTNTPIVAAGGIADGRGLAAALCLGASGVWMGTRFVATHEAYAHSHYQQAILEAEETSTTHQQRLFNIGWDHAAHRVLKNSTYQNWLLAGQPDVGQRPRENEIVSTLEQGINIFRYDSDAPTKAVIQGNPEAQALYAGQSVGLIHEIKSAADVVLETTNQALAILNRNS